MDPVVNDSLTCSTRTNCTCKYCLFPKVLFAWTVGALALFAIKCTLGRDHYKRNANVMNIYRGEVENNNEI